MDGKIITDELRGLLAELKRLRDADVMIDLSQPNQLEIYQLFEMWNKDIARIKNAIIAKLFELEELTDGR